MNYSYFRSEHCNFMSRLWFPIQHLMGTYTTPSEHAVNACRSSTSGRLRTPKANCESRTASEGNRTSNTEHPTSNIQSQIRLRDRKAG